MDGAVVSSRAPRGRLIAAFAAVYIVWGSTYLGIYYAIRTIPPFLMAGARFVIAGAVLVGVAMARGAPRPQPRQLGAAALAGILMLALGNGTVVWSETRVASGSVSLLVATVPAWFVAIEWVCGQRPTGSTIAGLVLGIIGIVVLIGPRALTGAGGIDPVAASVLLVASAVWAAGSLYTRYASLPTDPLLGTGWEMVAGGLGLLIAAAVGGDYGAFHMGRVSMQSWLGLLYLIVFGSLVAFTAYIWLVRHVAPALASTYAFVNPVIAVLLGWAIAGEQVTARTAIAAAIIVSAVILITVGQVGSKASGQWPEARGQAPQSKLQPARLASRP